MHAAVGAASHSCIVGIDLDRETAADIDGFKARALAHAEVQQCYYVTGPTDFILITLTRSRGV